MTNHIDPGSDLAAWVRSIDWETLHTTTCCLCGQQFTARGPARQCRSHPCEHPAKVRGVMHNRDGIQVAVFACLACGWLLKAPKADRARWSGEHVFRDLRDDTRPRHPCARCGRTDGTQLHHWAPRAIFGAEADQWPTSWLCPDCHRQWHQQMRRAQGHRLDDPQRSGGDTSDRVAISTPSPRCDSPMDALAAALASKQATTARTE